MTRAALGRLLLAVAYGFWLGGWFWIFSFGFSSSYFAYHLGTRVPVLLLALLTMAVPPLSCRRVLGRVLTGALGPVKGSLLNLGVCAAPLGLFWGVLVLWVGLARWGGRIAFEADEAMGNGILFMSCVAVVLVAGMIVPMVLGGAALGRRLSARRAGATARTDTPDR